MSSDDEDYMSNDFLTKMADVKPGVSSCRNTQRMLRISARNDAAKEQQIREKPATRMEMERNRLEEGINRPIESGNKGFKLLAMMGYKPGMSLGKAREGQMGGIKEPIQIELKAGRTGIGHEEEQKEKQKERCEAHMEMMRKRARMEEVLADDFRSRKRFLTIQKQLIGDIQKSRRACQEMDIRLNKESPEEFWFWPIYSSKKQMDDAAVDEEEIPESKKKKSKLELIVKREEKEEEIDQFMYSNGRTVPMDVNFWEMDEKQLECSLAQILNYMRTIHFYCIFCGCAFEDAEDLFANCPGPTRNQHDEE